MPQLDNKVALITGAAGGIGAASARRLAELGATTVLADIQLAAAQTVAQQIERTGGQSVAVYVDLAEEASIQAVVSAAIEQFGRIDVLHNSAADLSAQTTGRDWDVESMEVAIWDRTFCVNVRGTMLFCKHVLPHMVAGGGGSIINTASNLGLQGNLRQAAYAASKAAVIQLTRSIASSHGRRGIRCNTVSPGLVLTAGVRANLPVQVRTIVAGETLTPYLGMPEDIANAVVFLASDDARYVTGHNLIVDGGTVSHVPGFARFSQLIHEQHSLFHDEKHQ